MYTFLSLVRLRDSRLELKRGRYGVSLIFNKNVGHQLYFRCLIVFLPMYQQYGLKYLSPWFVAFQAF